MRRRSASIVFRARYYVVRLGAILAWTLAAFVGFVPIVIAGSLCASVPDNRGREQLVIGRTGGRAERADHTLQLSAAVPQVFEDVGGCDEHPNLDCRQYLLVDYWDKLEIFVVWELRHEAQSPYYLVSARTGRSHRVSGFPRLAPDRSRYVAISAAGESEYDPNIIEIGELGENGPTGWRVSYEPPLEIVYCFGGWINRDHLVLGANRWEQGSDYTEVHLIRTREAWALAPVERTGSGSGSAVPR